MQNFNFVAWNLHFLEHRILGGVFRAVLSAKFAFIFWAQKFDFVTWNLHFLGVEFPFSEGGMLESLISVISMAAPQSCQYPSCDS